MKQNNIQNDEEIKNDYSRSDYKRMLFIEQLVQHRNGDMKGCRDQITWLYYNYALAVTGEHQTAFDKLKQLNSTFTEPQSEKELTAQIKSVQKVGYYSIGNDKFLSYLKVTEEEKTMFNGLSNRQSERQQKRLEKEQRNLDIIKLRNEGKTEKEIADIVGASVRTVRNVLKDTNAADKQERNNTILRLHKQGKSNKAIAKETGIAYNTVKKVIDNVVSDTNIVKIKNQQKLIIQNIEKREKLITQNIEEIKKMYSELEHNALLFNCGRNRVTKNPIQYDRRNSKQPNGLVIGTSGSGKTCFVKNEINQVLDKTEDDVIIIDPLGEYARIGQYRNGQYIPDERLADCLTGKCKRIEFVQGNYINPLEVVIDPLDKTGEMAISEKADMIVGFIESLFSKKYECNVYEISAIYNAVVRVLTPFVNELVKQKNESGFAYDFEKNPTLKDVIDKILRNDNKYILELQNLLKARLPYLEAFCHKTNIPEERGLVLGFMNVPCKLEKAYYMAMLSFVNNRIYLNRIRNEREHSDKRLWFYLNETHLLFKNEHFADFATSVFERSLINGAICTTVSRNLADFVETKQGRTILSNSGFRIFMSQAPTDRKLMQIFFGTSDKSLEFLHNCDIGEGVFFNNVDAKTLEFIHDYAGESIFCNDFGIEVPFCLSDKT